MVYLYIYASLQLYLCGSVVIEDLMCVLMPFAVIEAVFVLFGCLVLDGCANRLRSSDHVKLL